MMKNKKSILLLTGIIAASIQFSFPVKGLEKSSLKPSTLQADHKAIWSAYKLSSHRYKKGGVTISYPVMTGLADVNKQAAINRLIQEGALRGTQYYSYIKNQNDFTVDIQYLIKWQSQSLLSIVYTGIGNAKGAAHPSNLYYTTNININKGTCIRLRDVVHVDKKFVTLFTSSKFKPLIKGLEAAKMEFGKDDYLFKALLASDAPAHASSKIDYSTFSYFTKDSLVVSVAVAHVEGDHAEYRISYDNLKGYRNEKSKVWKDFIASSHR